MANGQVVSIARTAPASPNDYVAATEETIGGNPAKHELVASKAVPGRTTTTSKAAPTDTSAQMVAANTLRAKLELRNWGSTTIYLKWQSGATTDDWPLSPGETIMMDAETTEAVFARTDAGTGDLRIREISHPS